MYPPRGWRGASVGRASDPRARMGGPPYFTAPGRRSGTPPSGAQGRAPAGGWWSLPPGPSLLPPGLGAREANRNPLAVPGNCSRRVGQRLVPCRPARAVPHPLGPLLGTASRMTLQRQLLPVAEAARIVQVVETLGSQPPQAN